MARYASTDGRATAAGTPKRINMPAIPPVTDPGIGSVLATCPTKYASATTGSSEGEPNARNIAHSTAASKVQYASAPARRGSPDPSSRQASRTAPPIKLAADLSFRPRPR